MAEVLNLIPDWGTKIPQAAWQPKKMEYFEFV